jgi:urease accessory protein
MRVRATAALAALLFAPQAAFAHPVVQGVGGFYGGLLHPLFVPAHLLALVGFGLLLGQQAPRARRLALAVLAAALLTGITAIASAFVFKATAYFILTAAGACGALAALARPVPVAVTGAIALVAGVTIMLESVPDEISMRLTLVALGGTAIGAFLAAMLAADVTAALKYEWQRIGVRILGSWIAASAILVLALRLAR